ncbi:hypothetical protein [Achromobacter sp. UMC71]|uniref:cytidine deaminase-like fold-containing protein n=1 Tax=Achromobacter sp. UMC71 TaxID=1862320 RepID=UPI00160202E7|nr:hypothetical protein [Achromobacter sp. UMC71]
MANAHAEIGVIEQAYRAGKTQGAEMTIVVKGKDVCGYCLGDIAAAADKAGLKYVTIHATKDDVPMTYFWRPGMTSIKELR